MPKKSPPDFILDHIAALIPEPRPWGINTEIAKATGISQPTLSRYFKGKSPLSTWKATRILAVVRKRFEGSRKSAAGGEG